MPSDRETLSGFVGSISEAPVGEQEKLSRAARWVENLLAEDLAQLAFSAQPHKTQWTLTVRPKGSSGALAVVFNDRPASIGLWRSVFERLASNTIARVEQLVGPIQIGQGNAVKDLSDEFLDALTAAYREAADVRDPRFHEWANRWMELADFSGPMVHNLSNRLAAIVALWEEPIPGQWARGQDPRLLKPDRYLRGLDNESHVPRGEHKIEKEILDPSPADIRTTCLGGTLVDGVNAVPLAKDAGGGRSGNVEADMLLLVRDKGGEHSVLLVEVKVASNNAWYAAVENLRQLRLYAESPSTQLLFHTRLATPALSQSLPATGVVLAPETFYSARGAKLNSVAAAQELFRTMSVETGVNAVLASWDSTGRVIEEYH